MNKLLFLILLNLVLTESIQGQSAKDVAKNVLPSTVLIVSQDINHQTIGLGSGFVVNDNMIVTNRHVIEGASNAYMFTN